MIVAILQARLSSSRFPGKVLKPLLGVPMLLRQIERVKRSKNIAQVIVATSTEHSDDPLAKLCIENGIECYRGSLNDVLDRFYHAASRSRIRPSHIVRLTGDCPVTDWHIIDQVIDLHIAGDFDYTTNAIQSTFPDGLDVEIMKYAVLERTWKDATLPSHREHVTLFINQQADLFKIGILKNDVDLSHHRWTVDEQSDFELVDIIYNALYPSNPDFITADILAFLDENPGLNLLNIGIERNEGLKKSVQDDYEYIKKEGIADD